MVHRRAGRQFVDESRERRRGRPRTRRVHDVVAEEAHRQHTPAVGAGERRRRRAASACGRTRHRPARAPSRGSEVVGPAVDVGELGRASLRGTTSPGRRGTSGACTSRRGGEPATNSSVEARRHGIDREPHAGVLAAFDVVVRLVLVPRRALAGAGLLDEDVVVVEPHRRRSHQLGGDRGDAGLPDEPLDRRQPRASCRSPRRTHRRRRARPLGQRRQVGQVGVDRLARQLDVLRVETPRGRNRPVALGTLRRRSTA